MTKAERIFTETKINCMSHIKIWGIEKNPDGRVIGFTSLSGDDSFCTRTFNDVQKIIDREVRRFEIAKKYIQYTEQEIETRNAVLEMVQVTLENHSKRHHEMMA